ncbi:MAG: SDR family oxidoreductase [Gammaproteobacteria bacterium]|nr:SDR family oxidoreductase [Gammaproteobacteria bacterium]
MRIEGKIAIVTGAASGFGAGIARRFAAEGAKVLVADIDADGAALVAKEIGESATSVAVDVSKAGDVQHMVETALTKFGDLDILVNNAGTTHRNQPLLDVDEATFDRVFDVNVKSIYLTARAVIPIFRRRGGGVILNVGSTAGLRPRPGLTWYNGSKGAVHIMSKSMALELAPDKIRVNVLAPVIGETGLLESFMGKADTSENRAAFIATIPWGRLSTPRDVANGALFLASDEAELITGIELEIDGGRTV